MRKILIRLTFIALILAWIVFRQHFMKDDLQQTPSTIDQLLQNTSWWTTDTGNSTNITISNGSDELQYVWWGTSLPFSQDMLINALQNNERVILIFERKWDPTSLALREDITNHEARIPLHTTLLFIDVDVATSTATTFNVDSPNTIIYLGNDGKEIRRKWNGIVSLSQIVKGIDWLQ